MNVGIKEAKNQLSAYGNLAHEGRVVTVCKNGKPWFDLVPHKTRENRQLSPLFQGTPSITETQAIAPVHPEDVKGWM